MPKTPQSRALLLLSAGAALLFPAPAHAQGSGQSDIIVTARKRDETSIAVPVTLTAVSGSELERRAINSMDGIARVVPALLVGENSGHQGGIVSIRGISGPDSNPLGDQAVSFNIDGVQVARATVRRMSEMDIAQVEVLKGPQALFFGKNSPAGIISVRTADPTDTLSAKLSAGYEFNAREIRTDGYISAPITDTFGFRVAGYFSDMQGWVKNIVPRDGRPGVFAPKHDRAPNGQEYAGRLTLKWEPTDRFNARLKLAYSRNNGASTTANVQIVSCPLGIPQTSTPLEDCTPNNNVAVGDPGPNFAAADPAFGDGASFMRQNQILGGLELNYNITESLTLTSVTGFYRSRFNNNANFVPNYQETGAPPQTILASRAFLNIRELTEEIRLTSNFDGPVNFMVGGLYQDSRASNGSITYMNAYNPTYINNYMLTQNGMAYSIFAQTMAEIVPTLELTVGARYSYEKKTMPHIQMAPATSPRDRVEIHGPGITRRGTWNNLSPEFTLSYRPTSILTLYASYKEGFLSGGFTSVPPTPTARVQYDPQTTTGYEGGIKAELLDGALRTNLSVYNYKTEGLQVTATVMGTQQELRNAGVVRTKGVEFDFTYRTPLDGLSFNGAVTYNRGRYVDYQAPCYRGASSTVCFNQLNRQTGQVALVNDLSGTELVRAPAWTGNAGFSYEAPLSSGLKFGLSGNVSHSDSYITDTTSSAGGRQKSYQLYDATIRLMDAEERWEAAFIGRNLSNTYYYLRTTDAAFTGSNPGQALVGTYGDTIASVSRGRELMLRLTYRFGG